MTNNADMNVAKMTNNANIDVENKIKNNTDINVANNTDTNVSQKMTSNADVKNVFLWHHFHEYMNFNNDISMFKLVQIHTNQTFHCNMLHNNNDDEDHSNKSNNCMSIVFKTFAASCNTPVAVNVNRP